MLLGVQHTARALARRRKWRGKGLLPTPSLFYALSPFLLSLCRSLNLFFIFFNPFICGSRECVYTPSPPPVECSRRAFPNPNFHHFLAMQFKKADFKARRVCFNIYARRADCDNKQLFSMAKNAWAYRYSRFFVAGDDDALLFYTRVLDNIAQNKKKKLYTSRPSERNYV